MRFNRPTIQKPVETKIVSDKEMNFHNDRVIEQEFAGYTIIADKYGYAVSKDKKALVQQDRRATPVTNFQLAEQWLINNGLVGEDARKTA